MALPDARASSPAACEELYAFLWEGEGGHVGKLSREQEPLPHLSWVSFAGSPAAPPCGAGVAQGPLPTSLHQGPLTHSPGSNYRLYPDGSQPLSAAQPCPLCLRTCIPAASSTSTAQGPTDIQTELLFLPPSASPHLLLCSLPAQWCNVVRDQASI